MNVTINESVLELVEGDITQQEVDAIVNAANSGLRGGGGVDGAIHRAGGPSIMAECRRIGGCPTGSAVSTAAGNLSVVRRIIHAVGPIYRAMPKDAELLASAYRKCLEIAGEEKLESVAFPSLSTGAYGYPIRDASRIALSTAIEYLREHGEIKRVRFVLFGQSAFSVFQETLEELTTAGDKPSESGP